MTISDNYRRISALRGIDSFATTNVVAKLVWSIGDVVRKERESRRLTQKQLAVKADVDRTALGRLENGGNFEQQTLAKLAKALRLTVADLYAEIPPAERQTAEEAEALRLFRGIKDTERRAQALERLERFSTAGRAEADDVARAR